MVGDRPEGPGGAQSTTWRPPRCCRGRLRLGAQNGPPGPAQRRGASAEADPETSAPATARTAAVWCPAAGLKRPPNTPDRPPLRGPGGPEARGCASPLPEVVRGGHSIRGRLCGRRPGGPGPSSRRGQPFRAPGDRPWRRGPQRRRPRIGWSSRRVLPRPRACPLRADSSLLGQKGRSRHCPGMGSPRPTVSASKPLSPAGGLWVHTLQQPAAATMGRTGVCEPGEPGGQGRAEMSRTSEGTGRSGPASRRTVAGGGLAGARAGLAGRLVGRCAGRRGPAGGGALPAPTGGSAVFMAWGDTERTRIRDGLVPRIQDTLRGQGGVDPHRGRGGRVLRQAAVHGGLGHRAGPVPLRPLLLPGVRAGQPPGGPHPDDQAGPLRPGRLPRPLHRAVHLAGHPAGLPPGLPHAGPGLQRGPLRARRGAPPAPGLRLRPQRLVLADLPRGGAQDHRRRPRGRGHVRLQHQLRLAPLLRLGLHHGGEFFNKDLTECTITGPARWRPCSGWPT